MNTHQPTPLTPHGQTLEDIATMRRIAREIDSLAERHPISSTALFLRMRADQIERQAR